MIDQVPESLQSIKFLLWWTGILTTTIAFLFAIVIWFAKDKVRNASLKLKSVDDQIKNLSTSTLKHQSEFVAFREKVFADIKLLFSLMDLMKKQTDKIDEIQIKTERTSAVIESQKDYGRVVKK